ncbi:hypothetical protein MGG_17114 [Pyricularia oryzae 70-15]|uniref:Uncharacterized protein n=1 Tax=Pyricularia oryzae (strain 70-15 / ATCC MYA-4617 / FGSC 8958) TaxID=242507 RepID=G4N956_PYRO7|nr:uncharacterized protein MGG_17114 [Pyricularia oryzae 70-15]EHA50300.1 hypothetical protein MGG_17114 [Pyricularia oryzae 70-15]
MLNDSWFLFFPFSPLFSLSQDNASKKYSQLSFSYNSKQINTLDTCTNAKILFQSCRTFVCSFSIAEKPR